MSEVTTDLVFDPDIDSGDETTPNTPAVRNQDEGGILARAAEQWHMRPEKVVPFMLGTVIRPSGNSNPTAKDCAHLLLIAMEHRLNPFTKEIHAFFSQGTLVPIVGIDGWSRIANANGFDGCEFSFGPLDPSGHPEWCEATVYVKGRARPVTVREYMAEVRRSTGPWKSHPRRMLRHKAWIQACRLAFSIAGVYDIDEAERIVDDLDRMPNAQPDQIEDAPEAETRAERAEADRRLARVRALGARWKQRHGTEDGFVGWAARVGEADEQALATPDGWTDEVLSKCEIVAQEMEEAEAEGGAS